MRPQPVKCRPQRCGRSRRYAGVGDHIKAQQSTYSRRKRFKRIEIPPFEDTSIDTIIFRRGVWIDFQAVEPAKT